MALTYSDSEIAALITERKPLPAQWGARLQPRPKRGHDESELVIVGENRSEFHIILRKSQFNPLDFSVILGVRVPQSNRIFRLRRYNGKSHQHTNSIEQRTLEHQTFYDFHIHFATERYQMSGDRSPREDAYAEVTNRYGDATGALGCLISDAAFDTGGPQSSMFLLPPQV